jgi:hypothetical protein
VVHGLARPAAARALVSTSPALRTACEDRVGQVEHRSAAARRHHQQPIVILLDPEALENMPAVDVEGG